MDRHIQVHVFHMLSFCVWVWEKVSWASVRSEEGWNVVSQCLSVYAPVCIGVSVCLCVCLIGLTGSWLFLCQKWRRAECWKYVRNPSLRWRHSPVLTANNGTDSTRLSCTPTTPVCFSAGLLYLSICLSVCVKKCFCERHTLWQSLC